MRSIPAIAETLSNQLVEMGLGKMELCEQAGITARTLQHVLSGTQDFKVSTLLAVADRLGLELVMLPKAGVQGITAEPQPPQIMTKVQAALNRVKARS